MRSRRQLLLSGWLVLTGLTVGTMLGYSMWLRLQGSFQPSRDWLGWSILIMLLSVYVSDIIRGVRRLPEDEPTVVCAHCAQVLAQLRAAEAENGLGK